MIKQYVKRIIKENFLLNKFSIKPTFKTLERVFQTYGTICIHIDIFQCPRCYIFKPRKCNRVIREIKRLLICWTILIMNFLLDVPLRRVPTKLFTWECWFGTILSCVFIQQSEIFFLHHLNNLITDIIEGWNQTTVLLIIDLKVFETNCCILNFLRHFCLSFFSCHFRHYKGNVWIRILKVHYSESWLAIVMIYYLAIRNRVYLVMSLFFIFQLVFLDLATMSRQHIG